MSCMLELIKLSFFVLLEEKTVISNGSHNALPMGKDVPVLDALKLDITKRSAGATIRGHAVMITPIIQI